MLSVWVFQVRRSAEEFEQEVEWLMPSSPSGTGLSGITWGGFDNHYYLFTYEETRDTFAIPHDIDVGSLRTSPPLLWISLTLRSHFPTDPRASLPSSLALALRDVRRTLLPTTVQQVEQLLDGTECERSCGRAGGREREGRVQEEGRRGEEDVRGLK